MSVYFEGDFRAHRKKAWATTLAPVKDQCKELLERLAQVLQLKGIRYSLGFGTLLGAYRDEDFIDHDTDVDILILGDDSIKSLNTATEKGLFAKLGILKEKGENKCAYAYKDIYCDLYPLANQKDRFQWLPHDYHLRYTQIPLGKVKLCGKEYPAPRDIEGYLSSRYKNWKTPRANQHAQF